MDKTTRNDFYVYALFRDDGRIFYVGKGFGYRWNHHAIAARSGKRGHRFNIIRDMQARGIEMAKVKIHEGLTEAVAHEYEVALIGAIGRQPHGPLTNVTDGGEGASGRKRTPEERARISVTQSGRQKSLEECARISASNTGKSPSAATREKLSAALLGIPKTAAHIANRSAAQRGRKWLPEHIAIRQATRRLNNERRRAAALIAGD